MEVYALLVGINAYPLGFALRGCRNDIDHVARFLRDRTSGTARIRPLVDTEATRQAVVDGFRDHLGQAGPDDVALLWFSGHGAQEPVPEKYWHLEPSGSLQTLVCADSLMEGGREFADKELAVLLAAVAERGARVVVVLDCCHSGGGTRQSRQPTRERSPGAALGQFRGTAFRDASEPAPADHVLLSACRSDQRAKERVVAGEHRGVFTYALLTAMETLGPAATYRELVAAARCQVENAVPEQAPVLYPATPGGPADQPFLGGLAARPRACFVLRHVRGGWEVDSGACHGMPPTGDADGGTTFAVMDTGFAQPPLVRARETRADRTLVDPLDWEPEPARQYPVTVASLALPPAAVTVGGRPDDDPAMAAAVAEAIRTAGPGGGPSPSVLVADPAVDADAVSQTDPAPGLRLRVNAPVRSGRPVVRVLRRDESVAAEIDGHGTASARRTAAFLEHLTWWTQVKELTNPASALAGAVSIELVEPQPGEHTAPQDGAVLLPDATGEIRLHYTATPRGWQPPTVFVRLRNRSDRALWCVLLDLTDSYRIHAGLFPGAYVAAGSAAAALDGERVAISLPAGRRVEPGAAVRDWLKLLVAEAEISPLAFDLPSWKEAAGLARGRTPARGVLDLSDPTPPCGARTAGPHRPRAAVGDWTTNIVSVLTEVPETSKPGASCGNSAAACPPSVTPD